MQGLTIETATDKAKTTVTATRNLPKEEGNRHRSSSSSSSSLSTSSTSGRSSLQSSTNSDAEEDDEDYCFPQDYDIETAIGAWDQITELTHEITSSLMAKQAAVLCQRFRRESTSLETGPPIKKRKVVVSSTSISVDVLSNLNDHTKNMTGGPTDPDLTVVTNIDEDTPPRENETVNATNSDRHHDEDGGLPKNLYEHVDRIGRMSRLVMEIEFCQKELRKEMLAMKKDQHQDDDNSRA